MGGYVNCIKKNSHMKCKLYAMQYLLQVKFAMIYYLLMHPIQVHISTVVFLLSTDPEIQSLPRMSIITLDTIIL